MKLRVKEFYQKINSDELDKHELIRILLGKYWVSYYHNDIENRASLINAWRIGTIY